MTTINPPKGLLEKILKRIHKEERLLVLRRIIIFSVMLTGSLLAFVPVLKILLADFGQSGFSNFFYLIFSDFSSVATYWQSFAMILLETLPAASAALCWAICRNAKASEARVLPLPVGAVRVNSPGEFSEAARQSASNWRRSWLTGPWADFAAKLV